MSSEKFSKSGKKSQKKKKRPVSQFCVVIMKKNVGFLLSVDFIVCVKVCEAEETKASAGKPEILLCIDLQPSGVSTFSFESQLVVQ